MTYHLCPQNGDSIAVPQLVFANLSRADESTIRVALYILSTGVTDPREIAHALGLKSVRTAENAFWRQTVPRRHLWRSQLSARRSI